MRLIGGAILLTVLSTTTVINAARDYEDYNEPSSLRGTTSKQANDQQQQLTAAELFPISDPLQDFARTGLDRSLSYISDSELNLPLSSEIYNAMSDYVTKYSVDGNDDNSDVCHFDYVEEEEEELSYDLDGRALQEGRVLEEHTVADHGGHSEHDYVVSTCNANLDTATCINWSEYFDTTPVEGESTLEPLADYLDSEVKIPCGVCVTLDASPGELYYGSTIEFGEGLNIVGKLVIPNDAKVHLHTKYVYVQGVFSMPEPPSGSSTGIPSETNGDRVEITLYGLDDLMFKADIETDNYHHGEKGVNNKAIVIAGGEILFFILCFSDFVFIYLCCLGEGVAALIRWIWD